MTAPLLAPSQDLTRSKGAWKGVSAVTSSSLALILGTLITSALGMVFWALAARLLTPVELGIGAVLISSVMTLSHAAQLNLRNLLHRFVPTSGAGAGRIIRRSYAAAAGVALLLGTGFVILVPVTTPDLAFLAQAPLAAIGFIAALLIWTLYALQEAALTARRLARFVPLQGLAYSCAKIVCLFAAVATISGGGAVVVAMILPALLIGLVTHMTMARQPVPDLLQGRAEVITRRQIFSFLRWDYIGALATSIALGVAPIVVTTISGAADLSAYYLAWSITYMLYLVARHVGSAMLSELWAHKFRRQAAYAEAIILTVVLTGLGVVALLLFAPVVMLIFGPDYVQQGSDLLRVLALSCIPGSVVTIYLAICRAEEKARQIALLQVTTLVALLAVGIPLTYALGPMGMAIGWLAAYSVAAVLMVVLAVAGRDGVELRGFAIDLISASQQFLRQLSSLGRPVRAKPAASFEMAGQTWLLGDVGPASLSDASTQVIESADPTADTSFILKRATSANGRLALEREYACLLRIRGNDVLHSAWGDLLPEALHFENVTEEATLLMSKLPGRDARTLAGSPDRLAPLLAAAAGQLAAAPLGERRIQGEDWLDRWIEAPLQRLVAHDPGLQHFQILAGQMRQHWSNTATRTGPAHGDFCLDNLMVEADEKGALKVSGLVDWGGFQVDAPAGFDLCTMAITLRAAASGRQLGQVVVELLNEPRWTEAELAWMSAGGKEPWMHDRTVLRATVLLVWLHHVDANLGKSARYSTGSFWGRVNIELVLRSLAPKPVPSAPRRQPVLSAPSLERTESPLIASLLLATGLLLWVASLPYIDPSSLGGFGLLTILPAGIYLAFAAIITGFCLSLTGATLRTALPFLFLVALVLLLHGTPAISYETLRYSWAWKHIGVIDYIMRHDSLDPTARYLSAYHNWPGFFLFSAWIANWFNLDPLGIANLARFFPTALNIGFAIAVPLLLRNFTQDRRLVWAATALFLLGNWVGQDYFSPQGTSFLFYICLFALLTGPLAAGRKSHHPILLAGFTLLALAIIGAIIATHQITPLFMLSALFCLALVGQVGFGYFLFALVAELLWLFYVADPFIAPELADLLAGFGKVGGETLGKLARTEIISAEQRVVSLASRGLSAVLGLLAILGVLLRLRTWKRDIVPLALMAAPMPVLFVTPYGGEVIFRLYLFATPLLAYFAASVFIPSQEDAKSGWRLPVLGIILLLMAPAFVLANNGKDAQYWFSPEEVEAADFLYGNSKPGQLLIEGSRSYPSQFRNYENFAYVPLSEELPELADELLDAPDRLIVRWLRSNPEGGYVVITRSQKAMFDAMGLLPQGALEEIERRLISSPDLDLVFANKDATILTLRAP